MDGLGLAGLGWGAVARVGKWVDGWVGWVGLDWVGSGWIHCCHDNTAVALLPERPVIPLAPDETDRQTEAFTFAYLGLVASFVSILFFVTKEASITTATDVKVN